MIFLILINYFSSRLGIGTGEFNIHDERLSSQLGVLNVPALCVISQGRVYHFNDAEYSEAKIKEFVRKAIPIKRFILTVQEFFLFFYLLLKFSFVVKKL